MKERPTIDQIVETKPLLRAKHIEQDIINKPNHYHDGGIDVITYCEMKFPKEENKGFYRANAIKYVTRYDKKNGVEDLKKAKFYIDKLIELEME